MRAPSVLPDDDDDDIDDDDNDPVLAVYTPLQFIIIIVDTTLCTRSDLHRAASQAGEPSHFCEWSLLFKCSHCFSIISDSTKSCPCIDQDPHDHGQGQPPAGAPVPALRVVTLVLAAAVPHLHHHHHHITTIVISLA